MATFLDDLLGRKSAMQQLPYRPRPGDETGPTPLPNYDPAGDAGMTLLGDQLQLDPALDWRLMDDAEPLSTALQPSQPAPEPRKALDVSKGAPSAPTQQGGAAAPTGPRGPMDPLKVALGTAADRRFGSEIGMAADKLRMALAPPGYKDQGESFWERLGKAADRPVQELQAFQEQQGKGLERQIKQKGLENDVAALKLKEQQMELDKLGKAEVSKKIAAETAKIEAENALKDRQNDRDSPESRSLQDAMAQNAWGKAQGGIDALRTMSAAQIMSGLSAAKDAAASDDTFKQKQLKQAWDIAVLNNDSAERRALTIATGKDATAGAKTADEAAKARMPDRMQLPDAPLMTDTARDKYRQQIISNTNFRRLIDQAKEMYKNTPRAELLNPWSDAGAEWDSLKGDMLAAYKADEGLGSLDNGVERLVVKVMGGTKDLATGSVETILNRIERGTKAKMDTWDHVYGYRLTDQPGQLPPNKPPPKTPPPTTRTQPAATTTPGPAAPPAPAGPVKMRFVDPNTKKETIRLVAPGDVEKMKKFGEVVPNG